MRLAAPLAALVLALAARPADAGPIAMTFTGGGEGATRATVGWSFAVNGPIIVETLLLWDDGGNGISGTAVDVGLWSGDGTLLTSGRIDPGAAVPSITDPNGEVWRQVDILDLPLAPGPYVIGFCDADPASCGTGGAGPVGERFISSATATTVPEITLGDYRLAFSESGLIFPSEAFPDLSDGAFGPNFTFRAPEPSLLVLVTLAGLGLRVRARRSRFLTRCVLRAGPGRYSKGGALRR
jgi:hypothetical protein